MFPSNVTVGQYIRFTFSALGTMFLGSQIVHQLFKPLDDLEKYIDEELKKLPEDQRTKVKDLL